MTIERACDRSAAQTSGQKFAAASRTRRSLPSSRLGGLPRDLQPAEPFWGTRLACIGRVEVAASIVVIDRQDERVALQPRAQPEYCHLSPEPLVRSSLSRLPQESPHNSLAFPAPWVNPLYVPCNLEVFSIRNESGRPPLLLGSRAHHWPMITRPPEAFRISGFEMGSVTGVELGPLIATAPLTATLAIPSASVL